MNSVLSASSDNGELSKCLVDLHGWCVVLPFHREGLAFLAFALLAFYQMTLIVKRMLAREVHGPDPNRIMEWHLLLGRLGLLFLILGTGIYNTRIWMGSFDISWPSYVTEAESVDMANQRWIRYGGNGAAVQSFLFWYQTFFQAALAPLSFFSLTHTFAKGILWRSTRFRDSIRRIGAVKWFASSAAFVTVCVLAGVFGFLTGPIQGPLELVKTSNVWSLDSVLKSPVGDLGMSVWRYSLLLLALLLLLTQDSNRRLHNTAFFIINLVAVAASYVDSISSSNNNSNTTMLPLFTRLMEQVAIASQIWADISHNQDDYGLTDEQRNALRRPLLQEHQEREQAAQEVDEEPQQQRDAAAEDIIEEILNESDDDEEQDYASNN